MTKRKKIIITALIAVFILVVVIPYAKVELLTLLHGDEFPNVAEDVKMLGEIAYIKVMEYSEDSAEVFCVDTDHSVTAMCHYKKADDEWYLDGWACIWSDTGSASDFTWPFYR